MRTHLVLLFLMFGFQGAYAQTELDKSLAPKNEEEVSNVFREMGVVQKRAMPKAERFLVSTYGTLDFSDGPYSNYSLHINPGYAVSDFVEVYINFVPFYIRSPRALVDKLRQYNLTISAGRPQMQYGLEVLWAPLYGKDSLGISRVVRSDTFVKFAGSITSFEDGQSGLDFKLGAGKTFFVTKSAGFRFCLDLGFGQQIVDNVKSFRTQFLTEFGMNFYL
jgi:hypothetical protein